jgi:Domain of unknown function DUF29
VTPTIQPITITLEESLARPDREDDQREELKAVMSNRPAQYETDIAAWSEEQAARLRQHSTDIDWDNLAEEIESLGRSDKFALKNRYIVLLTHWLKWAYQPERRSPPWSGAIYEQQAHIDDLLKESPSLRSYFTPEMQAAAYARARKKAWLETRIPMPAEYPFTFDVLTAEPCD